MLSITNKVIFISVAFLLWVVILYPLPGAGVDESPCVGLLTKKCTDCHTTERICRNLVKDRSQIWWQSNIENMVAYGAEYTQKEQEAFLECLLKPFSEIEKLCE